MSFAGLNGLFSPYLMLCYVTLLKDQIVGLLLTQARMDALSAGRDRARSQMLELRLCQRCCELHGSARCGIKSRKKKHLLAHLTTRTTSEANNFLSRGRNSKIAAFMHQISQYERRIAHHFLQHADNRQPVLVGSENPNDTN